MDNYSLTTKEYRNIDAITIDGMEYGLEAKKLTRRDNDSATVRYHAYKYITWRSDLFDATKSVKERTTTIYKGNNHAEALKALQAAY